MPSVLPALPACSACLLLPVTKNSVSFYLTQDKNKHSDYSKTFASVKYGDNIGTYILWGAYMFMNVFGLVEKRRTPYAVTAYSVSLTG